MSITPKPSGNVVLSESGSATKEYTRTDGKYYKSLSITNDGASDLTFTVTPKEGSAVTVTVKSNEVFDDNFVDFATVLVTTSVAYRIVIRE